MASYTQPTGFLAATFPATIASTTNITAGIITTVTTLTNLPSIPAGWLTAAGLATDAVTEIQSGLATQTSVDDLPTNAELATALGTADDVVLAAIATVQSDTNDIQTRLPAALESGRIAAVLDSATAAQITAILEDTGTTLPAQISPIATDVQSIASNTSEAF
jgi:hypothetical protein